MGGGAGEVLHSGHCGKYKKNHIYHFHLSIKTLKAEHLESTSLTDLIYLCISIFNLRASLKKIHNPEDFSSTLKYQIL